MAENNDIDRMVRILQLCPVKQQSQFRYGGTYRKLDKQFSNMGVYSKTRQINFKYGVHSKTRHTELIYVPISSNLDKKISYGYTFET